MAAVGQPGSSGRDRRALAAADVTDNHVPDGHLERAPGAPVINGQGVWDRARSGGDRRRPWRPTATREGGQQQDSGTRSQMDAPHQICPVPARGPSWVAGGRAPARGSANTTSRPLPPGIPFGVTRRRLAVTAASIAIRCQGPAARRPSAAAPERRATGSQRTRRAGRSAPTGQPPARPRDPAPRSQPRG